MGIAVTIPDQIGLLNPGISHGLAMQRQLPGVRAFAPEAKPLAPAAGTSPGVLISGQAADGSQSATFGDIWFDRIHIIPRAKNVGFVLSAQTFAVHVWDAFLTRAQRTIAIHVDGPTGVTVADPDGQPTHYAGGQIRSYDITVSEQGSARIDNTAVWEFVGIDEALTSLLLTGIRVVPFPFEANSRDGITERLGYLTDVLIAEDETEQRIQLRDIPTRGLRFTVTTPDSLDTGQLESLLYSWQSRAFGVPLWWDAVPLDAAVTIGDLVITVDTTDRDFEVGGLVMIWEDSRMWEVLTVASITSTTLTVTTVATKAWATAGVYVVPVRLARLTTTQDVSHPDRSVAETLLDFDVEAYEIAS